MKIRRRKKLFQNFDEISEKHGSGNYGEFKCVGLREVKTKGI